MFVTMNSTGPGSVCVIVYHGLHSPSWLNIICWWMKNKWINTIKRYRAFILWLLLDDYLSVTSCICPFLTTVRILLCSFLFILFLCFPISDYCETSSFCVFHTSPFCLYRFPIWHYFHVCNWMEMSPPVGIDRAIFFTWVSLQEGIYLIHFLVDSSFQPVIMSSCIISFLISSLEFLF